MGSFDAKLHFLAAEAESAAAGVNIAVARSHNGLVKQLVEVEHGLFQAWGVPARCGWRGAQSMIGSTSVPMLAAAPCR